MKQILGQSSKVAYLLFEDETQPENQSKLTSVTKTIQNLCLKLNQSLFEDLHQQKYFVSGSVDIHSTMSCFTARGFKAQNRWTPSWSPGDGLLSARCKLSRYIYSLVVGPSSHGARAGGCQAKTVSISLKRGLLKCPLHCSPLTLPEGLLPI